LSLPPDTAKRQSLAPSSSNGPDEIKPATLGSDQAPGPATPNTKRNRRRGVALEMNDVAEGFNDESIRAARAEQFGPPPSHSELPPDPNGKRRRGMLAVDKPSSRSKSPQPSSRSKREKHKRSLSDQPQDLPSAAATAEAKAVEVAATAGQGSSNVPKDKKRKTTKESGKKSKDKSKDGKKKPKKSSSGNTNSTENSSENAPVAVATSSVAAESASASSRPRIAAPSQVNLTKSSHAPNAGQVQSSPAAASASTSPTSIPTRKDTQLGIGATSTSSRRRPTDSKSSGNIPGDSAGRERSATTGGFLPMCVTTSRISAVELIPMCLP